MNQHDLSKLAKLLLAGEISLEQFLHQAVGIASLGEAQVDLDRTRRCGFPEVVFAEGKTVDVMEKIFRSLLAHGSDVFATRMSDKEATALQTKFPTGHYNSIGRTFRIPRAQSGDVSETENAGRVTIVTAGTSDLPVAEEARVTAEIMGQRVTTHYDVGVAGLHRLLAHSKAIQSARAIVVVAGMEGALASVVGGLVSVPVVAVPTSVGYGASFGGLAALLAMLNSCASNVSVVNIDNGFGGGYIASLINRQGVRKRS